MSDSSSIILHNLFINEGGQIAPGVVAQAHPSAGGGFGVMASNNNRIRAGQVIASVPPNLWLTAASARKAENLTKQAVPSPAAAICIHLVRQRLRIMSDMFLQCGQRDDHRLLLLPNECRGFSLAHVNLVKLDEAIKNKNKEQGSEKKQLEKPNISMSTEWIKRLPSQYDNLIQFAPHLELLNNTSNSGKNDDVAQARLFSLAKKAFDSSVDELIGSLLSTATKHSDNNYNDNNAKQTHLSLGLQQAYGLSKRYSDKTATEIARWRKMASEHLRFISYDSSWFGAGAEEEQEEVKQAEDATASVAATVETTSSSSSSSPSSLSTSPKKTPLLPPVIQAVFDQHRRCIQERNSGDEEAAEQVNFASLIDDRQMLVELFGWAYSSLMSRGFAHDDEVWLMQPWVDYFNYSPASSYNVNAMMNPKTGRFEFTARENIRPGTELCLHYGTYSDFELSLWYGFTLCDCDAGGSDKRNHQSECEYVFSPLADPDGEYSVEDFRIFVGQVVALAASSSSCLNERTVDKIATTVCKKMQSAFGGPAPRCTFSRDGYEANDALMFLCRKVSEALEEKENDEINDEEIEAEVATADGDDEGNKRDDERRDQEGGKAKVRAGKRRNRGDVHEQNCTTKKSKTASSAKTTRTTSSCISPEELLLKLLQFELEAGFFSSNSPAAAGVSRSLSSNELTDALVEATASDISSPCSRFARRIGKDTRDLLQKGVAKLTSREKK